jgi:GWxTD domain-containing protein
MAGVIRAERENCCDDLVVATQGDAYQYASALAALEHNRGDARQPALAANGGNLVKRIRRLLAQPETPRSALTPILSAAILSVTMVAALAAWQTKTPVTAAPAAARAPIAPAAAPDPRPVYAPAAAPQTLLAQAQQAPVAAEPESPFQKWVKEDVAYIITNEERNAYKRLPTNAEREHFIEQFWLRRDPTPGTDANEFKEEHYRRIAYTNSNFSAAIAGWKTDRGRIYISYGPPDEKEIHPTGSASKPYPYEQWLYRFIEGVGKDVVVEFIDPERTGEFRMTSDPSAELLTLPPSPTNGATVQVLAGKAMIALPLRWFEGHGLAVTGRVLTKDGALVTEFEESVAGGTANYVKTIAIAPGEYRLTLTVKDLENSKTYNQSSQFVVR